MTAPRCSPAGASLASSLEVTLTPPVPSSCAMTLLFRPGARLSSPPPSRSLLVRLRSRQSQLYLHLSERWARSYDGRSRPIGLSNNLRSEAKVSDRTGSPRLLPQSG